MMKDNLFHAQPAWFWGIPLFALLSMAVIYLTNSNQVVFLYLNQSLYFQPESIWINITLYGDAAMTMILLLPLIGKRPDIITKTFIAAVITTLFIHGFKELLPVARPPAILSADVFHQLGNQFSQSSFPSGHAAAVFTLASMIIFMINNPRIRTFFLVYASVISLSRIACGVHWPIDILAGMFFGWLAAFISFTIFQKYSASGMLSQRITAALLLLASIHLIFLHDGGDKEARFLEILTPVICLILSLKGLKSLFLDPILLFFVSKRAR